ncbi:DUF6082 family protein [Streptomyces sp. NPDC021100]|uniref:DUF6082 family protein n=1 Tax=Streptomyces sp. NPDC021100 TaxID=3365114 RepID=UPI0037963922
MKTSHAVLVLAAVGAVRVVQRQRHQQQHNNLAVARLYNDWLTHQSIHPDLMGEGMDLEEHVKLLKVNQEIAALSLLHRLGFLRGDMLRGVAQSVMERQIGQRYWAQFGGFRQQEAAGDERAETFHEVMEQTYLAQLGANPVGD